MNTQSLNEFFRSKLFVGIVTGVGITFIIVFIFEAGITVGYHEASFSSHWGQNYGQNFGAGPNDPNMPDSHMPNSSGAFGKIISVASATATTTMLSISSGASSQKPEQEVVVSGDTVIRDRETTSTVAGLTVGTSVIVLGTPNDQGEIEAKLIRIVPANQ